MSEKEKFESDLPVSEAEIEEVQEEKEKVSFLSSRKGRIILAASVGGVLLLLFLIFQIGGKRRVSASELLVLNGITKKLGFPELSKDTTIEEAEWFKSIQHLDDVEHAHARLLSKVVQKNSFPGNKGIIANHCLNYLLTQTQNKDSSFFGAALSDFEPLLMKIMVESKMYKEIVDLAIQHNKKLLGLMNDHFKVEDYARFVKALNDSGEKQAALILELKKSSHSFAKTAIYSHLLDQGFKVKDEFKALDAEVKINIFDYLFLNTKFDMLSAYDYFDADRHDNTDLKARCDLLSNHIGALSKISYVNTIWSENWNSSTGLNAKAIAREVERMADASIFYKRISLFAAIDEDRIKTINSEPLTFELFEKCINFLKQFSLENITGPVLSLYHLFVAKLGKDKISESFAIKSFLFENFSVSKMEISHRSKNIKTVVTFDINHRKCKQFDIISYFSVANDSEIPIIILRHLSKAVFKDSNVLENILKNLRVLVPGFKFKSEHLEFRFESLLLFIDSKNLRELAHELELTFHKILSYNSITKNFDGRYLPYELISHPKVEKLEGIYKPSSFTASELLEYNENDKNFKIFSIFSKTLAEDIVLKIYSQTKIGLGLYSIFLNVVIYLTNSERRGEIKNLPSDIKDFLKKDFPDLANVLDDKITKMR